MRNRVSLGTLTIAESGSESGELDVSIAGREAIAGIAIYAPAALTGAVTVEWSHDGSTWSVLQDGGSDVTVAAGDVVVVDFPLALTRAIRLSSDGVEASARDFVIIGYEDMSFGT